MSKSGGLGTLDGVFELEQRGKKKKPPTPPKRIIDTSASSKENRLPAMPYFASILLNFLLAVSAMCKRSPRIA